MKLCTVNTNLIFDKDIHENTHIRLSLRVGRVEISAVCLVDELHRQGDALLPRLSSVRHLDHLSSIVHPEAEKKKEGGFAKKNTWDRGPAEAGHL